MKREADIQLYNALKAQEFCYIFNSRQKGKSSLEGRARKQLEQEGFACVVLDVSHIGTQLVTARQWYLSLMQQLARELGLEIQVSTWWKQQGELTPLSYMSQFFEDVLLKEIKSNILIVIDEIDSVLSLQFPTDDFFAFIRSCYNQRSNKPAYERLTFLLIGVASPSDLVKDKTRTPFNLGRAINLNRFEKSDIHPLAQGLQGIVDNPIAVLEEIWGWTDGHPFLTQKICNLIYERQLPIPAGSEQGSIREIVEQHIIVNWEDKDNPEHLRTIEQRILRNEKQANRLLSLYQRILAAKTLPIDNSPEQSELMLSGIVNKESGVLRIANRIYETIFNQHWVTKSLSALKPYVESMNAWKESDFQDPSRLLHGTALQDALSWTQGKKLDELDKNFLGASKKYAQKLFFEEAEKLIKSNQVECERIFRSNSNRINELAEDPRKFIEEIYKWTGYNQNLFEITLNLTLKNSGSILRSEEKDKVAQVIQTSILQDWERNSASSYLINVRNHLFKQERKNEILALYKSVLKHENIEIDNRPDLVSLLESNLITARSGTKLRVSSKIHGICFNQSWVDEELTKVTSGLIINNRYGVTRELAKRNLCTTYLVKDEFDPTEKIYLAKQFSPSKYIRNKKIISEIRTDFSAFQQVLGKISNINQVPNFNATFEEGECFYIIQEFIEGKTLDDEIIPGKPLEQFQVITMLIETLKVLEQVHQSGLKHLNLCPDNLMRRQSDQKIALIDFAIFQSISAQVIKADPVGNPFQVGTPGYAAPELVDGNPNFKSDIYSVGMIGIQALTGKKPTELPEDATTQAKIWRYAEPGQSVQQLDERLVRILDRMIQPDLTQRYQTVSEALQELETLKQNQLNEEKRREDRESEEKRLKHEEAKKKEDKEKQDKIDAKKRKWRRLIIGLLIGVGVIGVGLIGFAAYQTGRHKTQRETCNKSITLSPESLLTSTKLIKLAAEIEDACTQLIPIPEQISGMNEANVLFRIGKARLVIWDHEKKLGNNDIAQKHLDLAVKDFQKVSESNGSAYFFLGATRSVREVNQSNSDAYQKIINDTYPEAITYYLKQSTNQIAPDDIPILVRLAFFTASYKNYNSESLAKANQLFEKAKNLKQGVGNTAESQTDLSEEKQPESLALIYNQAVVNARASNYREAIALLEQILSKSDLDEDSDLEDSDSDESLDSEDIDRSDVIKNNGILDKTYRSLGFIHLQLGDFQKSLDFFGEVKSKDQVMIGYQSSLKSCLEKISNIPPSPQDSTTPASPTCEPFNLVRLATDKSKTAINDIYPILPVYTCTDNPVLAIAEQALIGQKLIEEGLPAQLLCWAGD
ncbi:MAG: hypothetical protein F6K19_27180 [Cyanothece sp. SIO1E1]|nr:hypothetical protein [Cyanothece sp. SIO1E1]